MNQNPFAEVDSTSIEILDRVRSGLALLECVDLNSVGNVEKAGAGHRLIVMALEDAVDQAATQLEDRKKSSLKCV